MKKAVVLISFLTFLVFFAKPTLAQDRVNDTQRAQLSTSLEEERVMIEAKRTDLQSRIGEQRATRSARLEEDRKDRIRHYWSTVKNRLAAAISRLENLIGRIESRLVKIKETEPDLDLTDIEADLSEAKILLASAKADLEAADASMGDVLASEDPKAAFEVIKDTVVEIREKLKEVHSMLVNIITQIKGLRVGNSTSPAPTRVVESPTPGLREL